jgi:hypothetical protein
MRGRTENLVVERHGERLEAHRVRVRAFPRARTGDRQQFLVRVRERRAGCETRHRVPAVAPARRARRVHRQGRPQLSRLGKILAVIGWQLEPGRHDADDGEIAPVHADRPVQHAGIAAVPPLPECVAEHDNLVAALDLLVGREGAAVQGSRAERGEDVRRHARGANALRLSVDTREVRLGRAPGAYVAERPGAAVVQQLGFRNPGLVPPRPPRPDRDRAVGVRIRQGRKNDGTRDAEDRGVGADAET